jgi:hypothetical protein
MRTGPPFKRAKRLIMGHIDLEDAIERVTDGVVVA